MFVPIKSIQLKDPTVFSGLSLRIAPPTTRPSPDFTETRLPPLLTYSITLSLRVSRSANMRHTQKATKKRPFKNPEACRLKALQLKAECNLNLHRFYNAKQIKVPQNLVDIDSQFSWIAKMRNVPESDLHSIDIKEVRVSSTCR